MGFLVGTIESRWHSKAKRENGDQISQRAVQPVAPNRVPIPAVNTIASAPQKVTRSAPGATGAPPAYAARPPRKARKAREVAETIGNRLASAAVAAVSRGKAAPTAKLAAEVNAA